MTQKEIIKKNWIYFNQGNSKKFMRDNMQNITPSNISECRGIDKILTVIESLKYNEYFIIPHDQILMNIQGQEEKPVSSRFFKREKATLNLAQISYDKAVSDKLGPQTLLKRVCDKYQNENVDISRRGFGYTQGSRHVIMPQSELMRGWRLASLIDKIGQYGKLSHTGQQFTIDLKSTTNNFNSGDVYRIVVRRLPQYSKDDSHYWDWKDVSFNLSSIDCKSNFDQYTEWNPFYKNDEILVNFQKVAATLLRVDLANNPHKISNIEKSKSFKPLYQVPLNFLVAPTSRRISLDVKLQNNVLIESKNKQGNSKYKKLNIGEKEVLYSFDLHKYGFNNTFIFDESLSNSSEVFENFIDELFESLNNKTYK